MKKDTKEYFIDWYSETFGYGYGTGDVFFCKSLLRFFTSLNKSDYETWTYDYRDLENKLGGAEAWFVINTLCKSDLVEYGTSPRYAWLTKSGELMREFLESHTDDTLYELVMQEEGYNYCYKEYCNHTDIREEGCKDNPFFYTRLYETSKRSSHVQ